MATGTGGNPPRMADKTEKREILDAVSTAPFPADKDELLRAAEDNHAKPEIIDALRAMPPETYESKSEVASSVRLRPEDDDDVSDSPGQRAAQARRDTRGGHAQHQREAPKPPVEEELDRGRHNAP